MIINQETIAIVTSWNNRVYALASWGDPIVADMIMYFLDLVTSSIYTKNNMLFFRYSQKNRTSSVSVAVRAVTSYFITDWYPDGRAAT